MGAIAIRAHFNRRPAISSSALTNQLFDRISNTVQKTGTNDDIRVAIRFHATGIDLDLSASHPFSADNDSAITELASELATLLRTDGLQVDITLLRPGINHQIVPITSLPH